MVRDVLVYSNSVISLGLSFDTCQSFHNHISKTTGKIFASLRRLWLHAHLISTSTRTNCILMKTLLSPMLTYRGTTYLHIIDASVRHLIDRAFNACIRFAFEIKILDSVLDGFWVVLFSSILHILCFHIQFNN